MDVYAMIKDGIEYLDVHQRLSMAIKYIDELKAENEELKSELAKQRQFVDVGICLFRKKEEGTLLRVPYCPRCHLPFGQGAPGLGHLFCSRCDFSVSRSDADNAFKEASKSMT